MYLSFCLSILCIGFNPTFPWYYLKSILYTFNSLYWILQLPCLFCKAHLSLSILCIGFISDLDARIKGIADFQFFVLDSQNIICNSRICRLCLSILCIGFPTDYARKLSTKQVDVFQFFVLDSGDTLRESLRLKTTTTFNSLYWILSPALLLLLLWLFKRFQFFVLDSSSEKLYSAAPIASFNSLYWIQS